MLSLPKLVPGVLLVLRAAALAPRALEGTSHRIMCRMASAALARDAPGMRLPRKRKVARYRASHSTKWHRHTHAHPETGRHHTHTHTHTHTARAHAHARGILLSALQGIYDTLQGIHDTCGHTQHRDDAGGGVCDAWVRSTARHNAECHLHGSTAAAARPTRCTPRSGASAPPRPRVRPPPPRPLPRLTAGEQRVNGAGSARRLQCPRHTTQSPSWR